MNPWRSCLMPVMRSALPAPRKPLARSIFKQTAEAAATPAKHAGVPSVRHAGQGKASRLFPALPEPVCAPVKGRTIRSGLRFQCSLILGRGLLACGRRREQVLLFPSRKIPVRRPVKLGMPIRKAVGSVPTTVRRLPTLLFPHYDSLRSWRAIR